MNTLYSDFLGDQLWTKILLHADQRICDEAFHIVSEDEKCLERKNITK